MSMTIGQRLRFLREEEGLTQEEVANHLNVSRQAISKWELEKSLPDLKQIATLAEMYQISLDELVLGSKNNPSEKFNRRLQQEWHQPKTVPRITLEDYWLKGPNLQMTRLGKDSQLQMTLIEALASGQIIGTVFLIEGDYFPSNTIGNNGPKCQIEVTQEELILSEYRHFFIGWRHWPKNIPPVKSIYYHQIASVVIGVERRTGKSWGLLPNGQPLFSLLVDVFLISGEHWIFSCASLNVAPKLIDFFSEKQIKSEDVFNLQGLFNNSQINEPSNYLKENFETLLPSECQTKYDMTL